MTDSVTLQDFRNRAIVALDKCVPIRVTAGVMGDKGFRHLPLTSRSKLYGIVSARDIIDLLGGGKYFRRLILQKHDGNAADALFEYSAAIATNPVQYVNPAQSLATALSKMVNYHIGAIPILEDREVVGIVTEWDLATLARHRTLGVTVGEVMTRNVSALYPSATLLDAMSLMISNQTRHAPIAEKKEPMGIIDVNDILRFVNSDVGYGLLSEDLARFYEVRISELPQRDLVTIDPQADISEAAMKMHGFRVSAVIVTTEEEMLGIVTDRDLVTRISLSQGFIRMGS